MNYSRIYESIISRSKERQIPDGYTEKHHIIPRCMGGSDDKDNIAVLTPEEHFLCHVLLAKMNPENSSLIYAVNRMCAGIEGKRKRRKLYGWLKRRFSEMRSNDTVGDKNPQYGTIWINRVGTLENRKISLHSEIPTGWRKGRKLSYKNGFCSICGRNASTINSKYCDSRDCVKVKNEIRRNTREVNVLKRNEDKERRRESILKYMMDNGTDINNAMEHFGYRVPQYGNARNLFIDVAKSIDNKE